MFEHTEEIDGIRVYVDKVGGGTVGRAYEGDWVVTVNGPDVWLFEETLTTGTPKTHHEAAEIAIEFAQAEG